MRVLAYYRVSSAAQRDADTIASQRQGARGLAAARGWDLVGEYEDDGASARAGRLQRRPGFAALLAAVRAGAADAVLLVAFDRLTRSADLAELGAILGALQAAGVRIITGAGEETDLGTFGGRISALVRAQLAAEESEVKADRARRGFARTAAAGRPPCAAPWGLHFNGKAWSPGPAAPLVREVFERVAGGETCVAVAEDLHGRGVALPRGGRWCAASVARIVRCPVYDSGLWRASAVSPPLLVPALVDAGLAARARARLDAYRLRGLRRTRHVYLLDGLATCGLCGSPMRIHGTLRERRGKLYRYTYYSCERVRHAGRRGPCSQPRRHVEEVDGKVWAAVAAWLGDPGLVAEALEGMGNEEEGARAQEDAAGWRRKLDGLPAEETRALELGRRGLLGEVALAEELRRVARARALLERQVTAAEDRAQLVARRVTAAEVQEALARYQGAVEGVSAAERRRLVRSLCPVATVWPDRVELELAVWLSDRNGMPDLQRGQQEIALRVRLIA